MPIKTSSVAGIRVQHEKQKNQKQGNKPNRNETKEKWATFYSFSMKFFDAALLNPMNTAPIYEPATGRSTRNIRGTLMTKYCVTAANHNNEKDQRASEFQLWKFVQNGEGEWVWRSQGKKSLNFVAELLAQGNEVLSGEEKPESIIPGAAIELELRIARNDKNFKITDLPTF
jgi:hypothetical protein